MKLLSLFNFLSQADPAGSSDGDFWRNAGRLKTKVLGVIQSLAFLSDIPPIKRIFNFSYMSVATAQVSPFGKVTDSNSAYPASIYPTTMNGGGLASGNIDPYVILNNCTAKRLRITLGNAAVQQGTVGSIPVIRISLYKSGLSASRTLVGNFDIPLTVQSGTIGINTTVNSVLATGISPDQSFALLAGDCIGVEFAPVTTNNNCINSAGRMIAILETEE